MKSYVLIVLLAILPLGACVSDGGTGRAIQGAAEPYKIEVSGVAEGQIATNLSYLAVGGSNNFTVTLYRSGEPMWSQDYLHHGGFRVYRVNLGGEDGWGLTSLDESEWELARVSLRGLPWDDAAVSE